MKSILVFGIKIFLLTSIFVSCTKFDIIDTGSANGDHDMVMWDYFKTNPYDWDSVRVMIDHAGLRDVFEGKSSHGKDLTFLGITNHSIRRYLFSNDIKQVKDLPVEQCREIILSSIIPGRILLEEFLDGSPSEDPNVLIGKGGKVYETLSGKKLWIYVIRDAYGEVPKVGAKTIQVVAMDTQKRIRVQSSDIKTLSGVVHALDYNFTIKDI